MEKGKAGGPQRRPRRGAGDEGDAAAADPRQSFDADSRRRRAYDACVGRIRSDLDRMLLAMERVPPGAAFQPAGDVPLEDTQGLEQQLSRLRVQLEQAGDAGA